jgi:hypothetical protein
MTTRKFLAIAFSCTLAATSATSIASAQNASDAGNPGVYSSNNVSGVTGSGVPSNQVPPSPQQQSLNTAAANNPIFSAPASQVADSLTSGLPAGSPAAQAGNQLAADFSSIKGPNGVNGANAAAAVRSYNAYVRELVQQCGAAKVADGTCKPAGLDAVRAALSALMR